MTALGVALAAALGAILRAAFTQVGPKNFDQQMYRTAAINIGGSFLLGLLSGTSADTLAILGVGGLGAFTTFSTYISQIESINREGKTVDAILYGAGSLIAGIGAAYIGWNL